VASWFFDARQGGRKSCARSDTRLVRLRCHPVRGDQLGRFPGREPYSFPVGVPGLFRQYNAPADFVETANTIGLPRYAKQAVDQQFARWVMLHVQSNPLPICTRPRVLIKGKRT
jgi:Phage major capsid protein E